MEPSTFNDGTEEDHQDEDPLATLHHFFAGVDDSIFEERDLTERVTRVNKAMQDMGEHSCLQ